MNVRKIRLTLDLTQSELAKLLDVRRESVSNWERGAAVPHGGTMRRLAALCREFNIEVPNVKPTKKGTKCKQAKQ